MTERLTLSLSFRHLNTFLVSGMPANTRCNNALLPQRRNGTRAAPVLGVSLQWPAGPSQRPVQHSWPLRILLVPQQKGPVPFPPAEIAVGLARCHLTHTLKQNKGIHTESETGQDYPTQGERFRTSCEGSLFFKEVFQAHGPFLGSWAGVKSRYAWACLSQHEVYSKHLCVYCIQFVTCS